MRKLTSATKQIGPGENYLVEHSTGSGKSMTIAWLAYKLFSLHDENDKAVFDNVLVLSDRIVLVNQLGDTVKQFEKTEGVVKKVDKSAELANILENYKKIVISTQQKFPFAQEKMSQIKGKNFAIIIDEAHSSQTGESAEKVREVLNNSAQVERESKAEDARKDIIDQIEEKDIDSVYMERVWTKIGILYRVRIGPIKGMNRYDEIVKLLISLSLDITLVTN